MIKKRPRTRGHIVIDGGVPAPYKTVTRQEGWIVTSISTQHSETTDTSIAKIYGKNRRALLTTDKAAYKENVFGGFIGYVVIEGRVSKEEHSTYLEQFRTIIATEDKNTIHGFILTIEKNKSTAVRKKLPVQMAKHGKKKQSLRKKGSES